MKLDIDKPINYITSSYRHFSAGERHISRVARYSVLLLVYDGILRFGEEGEQIEVKSGEYYIQRAGLRQDGLVPSDSPRYYYVHFDGDFSEEGLSLRGTWSAEKIMPILEDMEGDREAGKMKLQKSLAFYSVLCELYRKEQRQADPLAARIMALISDHYREAITVGELARQLYISENYLILVFKREYGITPYKYITRLRLDKSVELLRNTTRSEDEIAASVGFSDFSVFYKSFCSRFGYSPSTVRKREWDSSTDRGDT